MRALPPSLQRMTWSLCDQLISSLTNVGLTIMVARTVNAQEFGTFTLLMATYLVCITVIRGLTSEPLLVRFSAVEAPALRKAVGQSAGATLVVGLVVAGLLAVVVLATGLVAVKPALIFLATLPGLLLQDHWRYAMLAGKEPRQAFGIDLTWALAQVLAISASALAGRLTLEMLVLSWGGAANIAALAGLIWLRTLPQGRRTIQWLCDQRDLAGRYAMEGLAFQGANQAVIFVLAAVAGLGAAGSLRAAQTLFGPLTVLTLAIRLALVPEAARVAVKSLSAMRRLVILTAALLVVVTGVWSTVVLLLPASVGEALLGDSWVLAVPLLLFVAVNSLANASTIGPFLGLRSLADSRRSLRARLIVTIVTLLCGIVGALLDDARGAAIGAATSSVISIGVWSVAFHLALSQRGQSAQAKG